MLCLLVEHDDGRIGELVPHERRDAPHDDARRHDEDERIILRENLRRHLRDAAERPHAAIFCSRAVRRMHAVRRHSARRICLRRNAPRHEHVRVRQSRPHAPRRPCSLLRQGKDGRPHFDACR